jgi:hypothetical protein
MEQPILPFWINHTPFPLPPLIPTKYYQSSPIAWSNPPQGFIKLNFDGVSKRYPSLARDGGAFRYSNGSIFFTYATNLGQESNNVVKL